MKVGRQFRERSEQKIFYDTHLLHTWGHETEYCTVLVIVIMTSKRLHAANEISSNYITVACVTIVARLKL